MRVQQAKVPTELRRKAAQHLESIRGTGLAPHADRARLSDWAYPIYRPDLDQVAYYEFEVDLGRPGVQRVATTRALTSKSALATKAAAVEAAAKAEGRSHQGTRGFIVVATDEHDFPIPHWSLDRAPVSRQLEASAEGKVARIYKLDALAYAAEDGDGELLAQTGQAPALVQGLPHDLRRGDGGISSLVAEPRGNRRDDSGSENGEYEVKRETDGVPKLEPLEVEKWSELKERYADAFGPFLDDLKRQAAHAWRVDKLAARLGEGIFTGEPHRVALLEPEAEAELSGEGAEIVELKLLERPGGPPALELLAAGEELDAERDLELRIAYRSGLRETLRFFVVSRRTPTNRHAESNGEEPQP